MCFPFNIIAFVIFFVSAMAETKRAPFDLPESESELVAGYFTEYSGMKFLLFWLGEFAEIVVASTIVVVVFLGGWQLPYFDLSTTASYITGTSFGNFLNFELFSYQFNLIPWVGPIIAMHVFLIKVLALNLLQIIIRWTLPRFRYDQLINLCWKIMLPIALVNVLATSLFIAYGIY